MALYSADATFTLSIICFTGDIGLTPKSTASPPTVNTFFILCYDLDAPSVFQESATDK
jgi:hypothetical protein